MTNRIGAVILGSAEDGVGEDHVRRGKAEKIPDVHGIDHRSVALLREVETYSGQGTHHTLFVANAINAGADLAAMGAAAKLVVGVTMFSRSVRALHGDPPALPSLPSLCRCVEMADAAGLCRGPSDGEDRLG